MKKKRKLVIIFVFFLFCAGCGENKNEDQKIGYDRSDYESINYESIGVPEGVEAFIPYADETILCSRADEKLYVYEKSGEEKKEVPTDSFYGNLCADENAIYAYDYQKSAIVQIAGNEGFLTEDIVIQDGISFHTIRNMVALNGKIYVLAIPFTSSNMETRFNFGIEEFEDNGEVIFAVNIENGQYQTLDLEHIMAEYRSEDGRLFFYGWKEEKYYLYEYDVKKGKISKSVPLDNIGNLMSIVVEGGYLFGISPNSSEGLIAIDLETREKVEKIQSVYAMFGNDLQFYRGNLFVNNLMMREIERLFTISAEGKLTGMIPVSKVPISEADKLEGEDKNNGQEQDTPTPTPLVQLVEFPQERETISVSGMSWNVLTDEIRRVSGLKTKEIEQSFDLEALIAEMMAGNPEVDIYMLPCGWALTQRIRDLGIYEPLNNSKIISGYLEKCFDYIQSAATAENGDIWMMPLYEFTTATWYIPENMEKFGVKPEELSTLDGYIAVLERLHGNLGEYHYFNNGASFFVDCDNAYDLNYNNYETGEVNFDTPLFRHIAEFFWPGWDRYSSAAANHPLFFKLQQLGNIEFTIRETPDFDRETVIFKTINIDEHLIKLNDMARNGYLIEGYRGRKEEFGELLEGWRVLPFPVLQSESEKSSIGMNYAYINPYSRQKEAALEYLEVILENQDAFVRLPLFFREDMEYYEQYYDTSLPAFQDIYEIFKNADVFFGHSWDLYDTYITDYQRGLISFDEAIERRQKSAATGLYE